MTKHEGALGAVYEANGEAEVAKLYDGWASTYDAEMAKFGYRHPAIGTALLARHCPRGASPLLDAGAGTGLVGEWLSILGYPVVEALDISQGMLDVAKAKNVYKAYHRLGLGGPLPFGNGHFQSIICVGVFTTGHVGPEGLDELVRVCATGGVLVITVKDALWQNGFRAKVEAFVAAGALAIAEQSEPYVSMPGEAATTPSRAVVLKRL